MSNVSVVAIALGLAMDAFAVSISSGVAIQQMRVRHALLIAGFFGAFQALMPLAGWTAGRLARAYVEGTDHWVAFGLLCAVGLKMIYESRFQEKAERTADPLNVYVLFALAIATSLDALAVGVSLSMVNVSIARPVVVIGAVTFVMSFAGTYIGDMVGHLFESQLEILGGLVLIGIGVKILLAHLLA
jgi:putative Mn2+ efflux pump MntP